MKKIIFYLESRGGMWPYHFFILNLGGLYNIIQKYKFSDIDYPIKIHMKDVLPFQREAFDIIKDKFELVEDLSKCDYSEIVTVYGANAECAYNNDGIVLFPFIKNLFTRNIKYNMIKGKRIFITRQNSESQHYGVLKRCIMNEPRVMNMLQKYNFERIQLENYCTPEKIRLFMESEFIISSNSGALTFLLFADKKAKVVEIIKNGEGANQNHYLTICKHLDLDYNRFSNITEDRYGNFNLNVEEFEKYLITLI